MMFYTNLIISLFLCVSLSATSSEIDKLIKTAARLNNVPSIYLQAIVIGESGINKRGWPWTLNVCGYGVYFKTRLEAENILIESLQNDCSVDVGLGQIHYQTHHKKFKNLTSALDPQINLNVAAFILREQYERTHDWYKAIGHYHSPYNKKLAQIYRVKILKILKDIKRD